MRKLLRFRGLLAFCFLWSIAACQEKESLEPALDFTSAEFLLEDLDALAKPYLKDGCDKKVFSVHAVATARSEMQTLAYILPTLHLQVGQAGTIRGFAKDHHRATVTHRGSISMIHQEILKKANAHRDELMKAYNEGRLSFAQLEEKLLVLRERVMAELATHEGKQQHMRILHEHRSVLLQNIETVLSPAQREQWNNWKQQVQS